MELEQIQNDDLIKLASMLYKKLATWLKSRQAEERLRKQYPSHSLFCECSKCLPSDIKYRRMQRDLARSMGVK